MRVPQFAVVLAAFMAAGPAFADTISYSDSVALTPTNWAESVSIPKFNPALGTLTDLQFTLAAHVEGSARFESFEPVPNTVTMNLSVLLTWQRPDQSLLVTAQPTVVTVDTAAAFDGVVDFDGPSGRTYEFLSADETVSVTSPPPTGDLALFTGLGNLDLPLAASGTSFGKGAGGLALRFTTSASATATVQYTYTPIPEPAPLGLLAASGLWLTSRR